MDIDALRIPLNESLLRDGLPAPWRRLDVVGETGSTNSDLITAGSTGVDIDGLVLAADHQTAGRGRNGRTWQAAPRAQLTVSVGVGAADVPTDIWGWLPLAVGVAVVDTVGSVAGVRTGLKWPNDVLTPDGARKLGGILAEVSSPPPVIVVGIGLNVTLTAAETGETASVSLVELGADATDRNALLRALLHELGIRVQQWRNEPGLLAADYRARSLTIGSEVRALLPGGREVTGRATDIDAAGRLCIDTGQDAVTIAAGDIVHLRTP